MFRRLFIKVFPFIPIDPSAVCTIIPSQFRCPNPSTFNLNLLTVEKGLSLHCDLIKGMPQDTVHVFNLYSRYRNVDA